MITGITVSALFSRTPISEKLCLSSAAARWVQANKTGGYTAVEILIAITVVVILTTLALPSLTNLIARNAVAGATNELIAGINQARSEAITRAATASICPSADGASCSSGNWEAGWVVFVDVNADRSIDVNDEITRISNASASTSVAIDGFNDGIVFGDTGLLMNLAAGTITVTHTGAGTGVQLAINNLGQVSTSDITVSE